MFANSARHSLSHRLPSMLLGAAAIWLGSVSVAAAEVKQQEGVVVSAALGKLTMNDVDGKPHSHTIGDMVKITMHGKPAKLEDLKLGMRILVMLDDEAKVLSVSTIDDVKYEAAHQVAAEPITVMRGRSLEGRRPG